MSFHVQFVARSIADARAMLAERHLPPAVAALIDKAIDAIPVPKPDEAPKMAQAGVGQQFMTKGVAVGAINYAEQASSNFPRYQTGFFGVHVEASGHIASAGDGFPYSRIDKLDVHPLVA